MTDMPYFERMATALRAAGRFQPTLVIDRDRLDDNTDIVKRSLAPHRALRLVDKSLAVPSLLNRLMERLNTRLVMSFHLPITQAMLAAHPHIEILFGKPMPAPGLEAALRDSPEREGLAARTVHLIDSMDRLKAYAQIAERLQTPLRFAFEIDVGMHRGGFSDPQSLANTLTELGAHPLLSCEGVMGYEAHIPKLPGFAGGAAAERLDVMTRYRAFVNLLSPAQRKILNIGGSNTALGYGETREATEVSMGSAFLKTTDFDSAELRDLSPAVFIATPVLKVVEARLPGPLFLTRAMQILGRFPRRGCYLYGGKWMAKPVHPPGLAENSLWGFSSNQQFMALPDASSVREDDFAFFRPTQSEAVLQQFGAIAVYSDGRIVDAWIPLPQG